MLGYVLEAAATATGTRPLVVVSPAAEAVRQQFEATADFAIQAEPLGTGDALRVALAALDEGRASVPATLLVLSGDTPLLTAATVSELTAAHQASDAAMTLTIIRPEDATGYGRVLQDAEGVTRIVEEKDGGHHLGGIDEVNGGLYAFEADWLRSRIGDLQPSAATGELYLTELVALSRQDGRRVAAFELDDPDELAGVNDRLQLAAAEAELRGRILAGHMLAGVTVVDPGSAYVDVDVELAEDVVLEPGVILRGHSRVGEGTVIGAGSQVIDSTIGAGCVVWASVVESSEIEDDVRIGPFAHLRPGSSIGRGARLGNFAEVKNSRLGPRVQQHHMSYLGDADVGEATNVGAGTITANYDGRRKLRTTIGKRVFLGVDTMLRAPVTLGDEARTGAGAVVTHDVPPGKLAVGVPARIRTPRDAEPASPDDAAAKKAT
jgi:bifunctional UDP-N-acetylglucosamine pyrophosphorylase / glucosamine-1-phosphate N-acetyltransferase